MRLLEVFDLILSIAFLICGFFGIGMTYYLGRKKVKEIDRLVYDRKICSDSIFHLILRLPNYGHAFVSPWFAKRAHLTHIRGQFDKDFERPFIITHYFFMIGGISLVLLFILDQFSWSNDDPSTVYSHRQNSLGLCSVVFALPSGGTSILWCGIVLGGEGGYGGSQLFSGVGKKTGEVVYETTIQN